MRCEFGYSAPDPPLTAQIQPRIIQASICAIRRNQTTIRKNRSVTFVGGLSLAAGDKNDTRVATSMWHAVVALGELFNRPCPIRSPIQEAGASKQLTP